MTADSHAARHRCSLSLAAALRSPCGTVLAPVSALLRLICCCCHLCHRRSGVKTRWREAFAHRRRSASAAAPRHTMPAAALWSHGATRQRPRHALASGRPRSPAARRHHRTPVSAHGSPSGLGWSELSCAGTRDAPHSTAAPCGPGRIAARGRERATLSDGSRGRGVHHLLSLSQPSRSLCTAHLVQHPVNGTAIAPTRGTPAVTSARCNPARHGTRGSGLAQSYRTMQEAAAPSLGRALSCWAVVGGFDRTGER